MLSMKLAVDSQICVNYTGELFFIKYRTITNDVLSECGK
jgi:hypothetical protein